MSIKANQLEAILEELRVNQPDAMDHLRVFAEDHPNRPDAWAHYAWNLFYRGYGEETYKASKRLIRLTPKNADALQLHSRACFRIGLVKEGSRSLQRAAAVASEPFPYRIEWIETCLREGKPFSALSQYLRLRMQWIRGWRFPRGLGRGILIHAILTMFAKLLLLSSVRDAVFGRLYAYYVQKKRWNRAYILVRCAVGKPDLHSVWPERIADALYHKRDFFSPAFEEEITWRAVALRKGTPHAIERYARANLHAGYSTVAVKILDQNPPQTFAGMETYAHALAACGRYDEAETFYAKLGENDPIHFANAGIACLFAKEYLRAQMHFDDALRMNPSHPIAAFLQRAADLHMRKEPFDARQLDAILRDLSKKHGWRDRISQFRENWEPETERLLQTNRYRIVACPLCSSPRFQPTYLDPVPKWVRGRCEDCGFLFANPQPLPETLGDLYMNEESQGSALQRFFRKSLNELLSQSPEEVGKLFEIKERFWTPEFSLPSFEAERGKDRGMLDIGCSVGTNLYQYHCRGWRTCGIDLDGNAVAVAQSHGLDARVATIEDADFPVQSFDLILMMDVIEHVPDPLSVLRKLHGLLKPGGILKVKNPCAESVIHYHYGPQWISSDTHLIHFSRHHLTDTFERFGFEIIATRSYLEANKIAHTYDGWRRLSVTPLFDPLVVNLDVGDTITVLGRKR
ncbi:MAG: methyltransferase domain-containing protein [Candidatus Omnitrophota bacterium]|jgi:SAM-dependent methyltransferase|nr:MAG: methyltransferase domain-containing protein [Candidatus Omnitrophota bacterium]